MFQITTPTEVKLCSMTPRTEKHGDEDVSAVSLSLRATGGGESKFLAVEHQAENGEPGNGITGITRHILRG